MSEEHKKVTRAAGIHSAATSLSRILGLVRDMTMTYFFGTTTVASSFLFAFTVPNLLRKLFGEGAMASAFVPLFAESLHKEGKETAYESASVLLTILSGLLAFIAAAIAGICLVLAAFVADDTSWKLTMLLTALMIPYCILICLTAVCGAMLNTMGHFAKPALAPVILNVAIIVSAWLGAALTGNTIDKQIYVVAAGVLIGGAGQLGMQIPELRRRGFRFAFLWQPSHAFVSRIITIMAPAVIGVGVTQFNIMVDRFLAKIVNERGVSVLFYADRLVELPLGVFGVALATAVLPSISFFAARNEMKGFTAAVAFSMRQIAFIIIPSMVGLILLAEPVIALLFQRGEFTAQSTLYTARALQYYALGLTGFAFMKIIVPAFYAQKDTRTPVTVGVCVLVLNVILNLILMQFMEERGLALSTTICAYVNTGTLLILLRRKTGPLGMRRVIFSLVKIMINAAVMGCVVWITLSWVSGFASTEHIFGKLLLVFLPICAGLLSYIGLAILSGQAELRELLSAYFHLKR